MGAHPAPGATGPGTGVAGVPTAVVWTPDARFPQPTDFPRPAVAEALEAERTAPPEQVFRGTTHRNTVVHVPSLGRMVVVRRRIPGVVRLERSLLDEHRVLGTLERSGAPVRVPRVLALGTTGTGGTVEPFAVHSYETGGCSAGAARPSRGEPVAGFRAPEHPADGLRPYEVDDLVRQLRGLTEVDYRGLGLRAEPEGADFHDPEGLDFYGWLCRELLAMVEKLPDDTQRHARRLGCRTAACSVICWAATA